MLFNSGAEAVENAVKVARLATGRDAVVAFDHAYHGRTNLTMALTAKAMPYKTNFGPFAPEVYRMPMSYPYREENPSITGAEAAKRAITMIEKQIGGDQVAAIIIEPIQGEGGFIVPAEGFLPALADWAKANGVVFIADEVQSGFCRTGEWFAVQPRGRCPGHHHHGQGHRRRHAALRDHRPRRPARRRPPGRPGRHLRRQPGGVRRRAGRDRLHGGVRPRRTRHATSSRSPRDACRNCRPNWPAPGSP